MPHRAVLTEVAALRADARIGAEGLWAAPAVLVEVEL